MIELRTPEHIKLRALDHITQLYEKGYTQDYAWRFAKAAMSWCEKESFERLVWLEVIEMSKPAV